MTNLITRFQNFLAAGLVILLGTAFLPFAGVQNDEALFAAPIYLLNAKNFTIGIFHRRVPIMVMSYVGTLKTLLYLPILSFFGANIWSVRLPMVLVGALTVFFLFKLVKESAGPAAAAGAAFLLATDACFLLTDTFDWGPVALEHFLLVTACFLLLRFSRKNSMRDLALGFFFLGLALWNKAIFLWALAGLTVAAVVVLHRHLLKFGQLRFIGVGIASFLVGALPFVIYNVHQRNATLGENAHFDTVQAAKRKIPMMIGTLDGGGLLGFLPRNDDDPPAKPPATARGRFAAWIRGHLGSHRQNGFPYVFLFCLACVPWWRRRRLAWFSLIFIAVTWTAMLFSRDAGNAVHHTILVWPFPLVFMAVALTSLPWPRLAAVALTAMVVMNLLVLNEYIAEFDRNGSAGSFTDALLRLPAAFPDPPQLDAAHIYVMDWGMLNTLALFHRGRLPLMVGDPPFYTDHPDVNEQHMIGFMMNDPRGLFVGHTAGFEVFPVRDRVEKTAAARGLQKEVLQIISDSNGRPAFEIYRLRPK